MVTGSGWNNAAHPICQLTPKVKLSQGQAGEWANGDIAPQPWRDRLALPEVNLFLLTLYDYG